MLDVDLATKQSRALIRTFKQMKDYIVENQGLLNQRDFLRLSLVVENNKRNIKQIESSLNFIDNAVADVVDQLGDVVRKSELSETINKFSELDSRTEYVLMEGEKFESDLAYSIIYQRAKITLYVIDNYIGIKTLALLKNSDTDVEITLFSDNVGNGLHNSEFKGKSYLVKSSTAFLII